MIIDFSISNYRSIREMQTLSFEATEDTHLEDYFVIKKGKYRLLKIASILGANASGKSNILKAFYMFDKLLLKPCNDKSSTIEYDKFALDTECKKTHSKMVVNFIVGTSRYMYETEFDNRIVYHETLKCQPFEALREHIVYERFTDENSLVSTMKFGEKYRSANAARILSGNLIHNRTLFGAYQKSNVDIQWMKDILDWIEGYYMPIIIPGEQNIKDYVSKNICKKTIDKQSFVSQITKADIGVGDLDVTMKQEPLDKDLVNAILKDDNAPEELKENLRNDPNSTSFDIHLSHNGHQGLVPLDYDEESGGTQRYYELSGLLLKVINESHFLAIDELECRLHPDLYQHFIMTYLQNSRHSQMIFTTHMREFLADRNLFRDDSVWITEKTECGDTELYSIADFDTSTLRGVSSRYNAYRAGRLGGIPNLGDTFVPPSNYTGNEKI